MTHAQTLYVDSTATFAGTTVQQTSSFQWQPFIANVNMGSPYLMQSGSTNELVLPYYFEASAIALGNPATIHVTINNASSTIASGDTTLTIQAINSGNVAIVIPTSTYQQLIGHSEDWTITVQFDLMGATVEKEQSYHWNGGIP